MTLNPGWILTTVSVFQETRASSVKALGELTCRADPLSQTLKTHRETPSSSGLELGNLSQGLFKLRRETLKQQTDSADKLFSRTNSDSPKVKLKNP